MTYASGGVIPPRDDNDSIPVLLDSSYVFPASVAKRLRSFAVLNNFVGDDVTSANPPDTAPPA